MAQRDETILSLTARIVSAHAGHQPVPARALPGLIREVYQALAEAGGHGIETAAPAPAPSTSPAGATVFADRLVCQDCGMSMKMLKRHLKTVHDMTPAQYRAAWNLPPDYPMVAREYATLRSNLAKESGLGKRPEQRGR